MNPLRSLAAALAVALPLAGCSSSGTACPNTACLDSASVTFLSLANGLTLPATVTVCLDATCSSFRIDHTGAAPICTALTGGSGLCTIDGEGNIALTSLPLPSGTTTAATVAVHGTVMSTDGTTFDQTDMAVVADWPPDRGACPAECHHTQVTFSSSP
jgi:hypothetical protein